MVREVEVREQPLGVLALAGPDANSDRRPPRLLVREHKILEDRQVRKDSRLLERADQSASCETARVGPLYESALEPDGALIRRQIAGDEGRLVKRPDPSRLAR